MLSFDTVTAAELAACTTKTSWCAALIAALGSSRTVTGKRAASGDAWAGVTFIDAPLSGAMSASNGAVSALGAVGLATTQQAADLSTGVAVLRIAGGARWVQGTVGLTGSGADFILPGNPSATKGFGFRSTTKLRAPANLPLSPIVPPAVTGAYRTTQSRLIVDLNAATPTITASGSTFAVEARASVDSPKINFDLGTYGPTWAHLDFKSRWAWVNAGGDWINASGTPQATTNPHLSFSANTVASGDAGYSVDATAAVQAAQAGGRWLALMLIASGGGRSIVTPHHGVLPAPRIEVTYTDGQTATLACTACVRIHVSLTSSQTGQPLAPAGRVVIEFEKPIKAVSSATMHMRVDAHTSTATTINGYLLNPNVNSATVTTGLAAAYPGDDGIAAHPDVLFSQSYPDGTTLSDRVVTSITPNTDLKSIWDPGLYAGADDLTRLPTAFGGQAVAGTNKWIWKQATPSTVSIVPSTYTGDGYVPSAPGRGAMRVVIPGSSSEDGANVGSAGSLGSDLWALFPKSIAGYVSEVYTRFKVRIHSQPKSLAEAKMFRPGAGTSAYYTLSGGKWGIGPHHWTKFGGNNNNGGGVLGWSDRLGHHEAPVDLAPQGIVPYVHSWDQLGRDLHFGQNGLGSALYPDTWYDIEVRIKLNTWYPNGDPSPSDAVCEIWIDGRLAATHTGFKYRDGAMDPNYLVTSQFAPFRELGAFGLCMNHFNGGNMPSDHDTVFFYDAVVAATSRIGPMATPATEYPWADGLPGDAWVQQTGMQKFYDFAAGPNGVNQSGFRGTNPLNSMVNAYCDPAIDPETGDQYFYGGGHGDGTCNAIIVLRAATLTWEVRLCRDSCGTDLIMPPPAPTMDCAASA